MFLFAYDCIPLSPPHDFYETIQVYLLTALISLLQLTHRL